MLVSKICLTGGPCAGKSTALASIERELTDMGYKVFIVNETATRLIDAGIKPFGDDSVSIMDFEDIVLKTQLLDEENVTKVSNILDKKCIIICDRGIFDIKSFVSKGEFNTLLKKYNLSSLSLMDNYNLVIHMNTAAKGAEKFYTTCNNKARREDIKEAKVRDDKCQDAYSFHNNFKIIDNSTSFDIKVKRVIDEIKTSLGIEKRCERKYLVNVTEKTYNKLKEKETTNIKIKQTYLENDKDCEMRLRKRTLDGDSTYYVTIKRNDLGKETIITEDRINKKTYDRLLSQRNVINEVNKDRICFTYQENLYKLDKFSDGTYVLEASFDTPIPPFIDVIEEVTLDERYKNINMKIIGEKENDLCKRK